MADTTETIPFSFNEIYTDIKTKLENKGYDLSEGSNTAMLADIMSYLISMLNVNTALNINETMLEYAEKRENIVEDARNLGYEIRKKTSYIYEIAIEIGPGTVVIPNGTEFNCDGKTYYYLGEKLIFKDLQEKKEIVIRVKEGTRHSYLDDPESLDVTIKTQIVDNQEVPQYYIDIPYTDIEDDGIEVLVSYYDKNGIYHDQEVFSKSDVMIYDTDSDSSKKFIRVDNTEFGTPRIYFKYANMGDGLQLGSRVRINVLETSGINGQISDTSDPSKMSCSIDNVNVKKITLVQAGADEEDDFSVKSNAPKYYNSNNRLVAINDYIAACNRDARVKDTIVWGGEDEFPISPGHIWFSFFPSSFTHTFTYDSSKDLWLRNDSENYYQYSSNEDQSFAQNEYYSSNYISNSEIRSKQYNSDGTLAVKGVWDKLDEIKIPTLEYHSRNPIYCEMSYNIEILKYLLTDDKDKIHKEIFTIIDNCFTGKNESINLEAFKKEYFLASIIKRIDKRVTDISGFNIYQKNQLVLNTKTLCCEQRDSSYLDQFIPLSVPYEKYFDDNGFLMIDVLPNIDTPDFIRYLGEDGNDLFVDWSEIREDIKNGITQEEHKLIIAPVMCKQCDRKPLGLLEVEKRLVQLKFKLYPDDCLQKEPDDYTFNNVKIYISKTSDLSSDTYEQFEVPFVTDLNDTEALMNGFYIDKENPTYIHLGANVDIKIGDTLICDYNSTCGFYYLFNNIKKDILVHLFVDGSESGYKNLLYGNLAVSGTASYLYTDDSNYLHTGGRDANPINEYYLVTESDLSQKTKYVETYDTTPKSYLYTTEGMYLNTPDSYYLTTNGYLLDDVNSVDIYSGPIVREINSLMYTRSPLKADLFFRNRYLNLKYNTDNFELIKNVIPRLKEVRFSDIL